MSTVENPSSLDMVGLITKHCAGDVKAMDALVQRFAGEGVKFGQPLTDEQRTIIAAFIADEERTKQESGIGEVPKARHLCTDLANANRIRVHSGKQLISVKKVFYAWQGTHWGPDDAEAHRLAARLSKIVAAEAAAAGREYRKLLEANQDLREAMLDHLKHPTRSNLSKSEIGQRILEARDKVEALQKWSKQCEMRSCQDNALGLLRSMLDLDPSKLDRDPWLLNCKSGTVDLRTGQIKPHSPSDFITRCAHVTYEPHAKAPVFEQFLLEILDTPDRVAFVQRWYGYAATGDTREQILVFHVGEGGNGKSTLKTAVEDVLGEYAVPAPPKILADEGRGYDRHPTEIADLWGRRLVTSSESAAGEVLRETFVKQATGEDALKGRFMRGDFFSFRPTHKLQLLTNHEPMIVSQDFAIWRRILLINYAHRYGSPEEVASDIAERVKDPSLPEKLRAERAGIFAWLVRGAVEWSRMGLRPPASVLAATERYRSDQDRLKQFITDCCELDPQGRVQNDGPGGLYHAYKRWADSSGLRPISNLRFRDCILKVSPTLRPFEGKQGTGSNRRTIRGVTGLRLLGSASEYDFTDQDAPQPCPKPRRTKNPEAAKSVDPPVVDQALDTSWLDEETQKPAQAAPERRSLVERLGIDPDTAERMAEAGFSTLEDVIAPGFVRLSGYSEGWLRDLQSKARDQLMIGGAQ
jgi:putative DNA primase/helicase